MIQCTDYQMLYQHLPLSRLLQIKRSTEMLLRIFEKDNCALQTTRYQNMAVELRQQWHHRLQYLEILIGSHAEPPIPLPKPTQPNTHHC